jgi:hypothetical protein
MSCLEHHNIILAFCVVLLCVFTLWCPLRIPHKNAFLSPVLIGLMSYLCYLCLFAIVVSNTYCVAFLFGLSSFCVPMLPVSLDYPFSIAPSVFSNVYVCFNCIWKHLYTTTTLLRSYDGMDLS